MNAITSSNVPDFYHKKRTTAQRTSVSARHRFVLELHLAGYKVKDQLLPSGETKVGIMTLTGYSEPRIYAILNSDGVIALKQQIVKNLDSEFEAQYRKVIDAVDTCLDPTKPDEVKLKAAKLWGEFHKKFQKVENNNTFNVTAEDVVFQIMNGNYNPDDPDYLPPPRN